MRAQFGDAVENARVRYGEWSSETGDKHGAFFIECPTGRTARVFVMDDDSGWEHVSVSVDQGKPVWEEMCWLKSLFWEPSEYVAQYFGDPSRCFEVDPNSLRLWKPTDTILPIPPRAVV